MRLVLIYILISITNPSFAFEWQDLWLTHDQQASKLMAKGEFTQANQTFDNPDWQAASAYRAGDFPQAAKLYASDSKVDGYYNQGNALAHAGEYEEAIKAYDKALAINPQHQDAIYNRKIVEELLKKDQQNKDKQDKDQQDNDKQDKDKQDKDKQDKDKQDKDKQDKDKQDKDKQDKDKQDKDKQDKDKQNKDKQNKDKQNKDKQESKPEQSQEDREKEQEKDQWLRLVPDDPGGLLRQKFLRDHLRRQNGWDQ